MTAGFELRDARAQAALGTAPFHQWTLPDGSAWAQFHRAGAGYLLRFPELADFEVSADALAVACHPAPGADGDTAENLYLNQVLPLVLSKRGKLVFHASAVEIDDGAVAFAAESGRGKSTLAASFAASGRRFLTDDGLVLEPARDGFEVQPGHASIRLWADSREALLAADAAAAAPAQHTSKQRFLAGMDLAFCPQARPLRRAYFLGDGGAAAPTFARMSAAEALLAWVQHSFLLDFAEQPLLAAHFDRVAALANLSICYRLDYPRRYGDLPQVRQAILEHCREEEMAA
jgi:hypothetical protein